jgi:hypothetical protein
VRIAGGEEEQRGDVRYRAAVRAALVVIAILAAAGPARADVWPRSLVLARGELRVRGTVAINLGARIAFEPVSLAPDAWWGATDRLTVGVVTSAAALSRVEPGGGLCLTGSAHGCPRLYDNVALDGLWSWRRGALAIAARTRLALRAFSPAKPSLRPGALIRWRRGAVALEADPHLQLGLAHRDQGNRDQLAVPLWLRFQLGCRAAGWVQTGVRGELAGFSEKYEIPLAVGVAVRVGPVDVGAELGAPAVLGPQNELRDRSAYVFVEWARMPP